MDPFPSSTGRAMLVDEVQRAHVQRLLERAVGLGALSLEEFTTRFDRTLTARSRGELNAVVVDLPGIRLRGSALRDSA